MHRSSHDIDPQATSRTGACCHATAWRLVVTLAAALSLTGMLAWNMSAAPMMSVLQSPIDTPTITPTAAITATASTTPTADPAWTHTPTPNPAWTQTPTPTPTATPARWVSGTVYLDADHNQVKGITEPGIPEIRVYLRMSGGSSYETETDSAGRFQFVNMSPGQWWLGVDVPAGMELTSIAANPLLVIVGNYALLDIPLGLAFLPESTPTPTATVPKLPEGWLPLIACDHSDVFWLPTILISP